MPLQRNQQRLLRSLALLWARLGSARVYVAIVLGILLGLAFLGVWQIVSWAKQVSPSGVSDSPVTAVQPVTRPETVAATPKAVSPAEKSDTSIASLSPAAPISSPTATPGQPSISQPNREVEITGINETKRRGRRGETFVEAKVGLASRSDIEKGNVEIRILFFDVTRNNEIVPTDAQVTYRWLTPVRDWSDPNRRYRARHLITSNRVGRRPPSKKAPCRIAECPLHAAAAVTALTFSCRTTLASLQPDGP